MNDINYFIDIITQYSSYSSPRSLFAADSKQTKPTQTTSSSVLLSRLLNGLWFPLCLISTLEWALIWHAGMINMLIYWTRVEYEAIGTNMFLVFWSFFFMPKKTAPRSLLPFNLPEWTVTSSGDIPTVAVPERQWTHTAQGCVNF